MSTVSLSTEQYRHLVRLLAESAGILTAIDRQTLLDLAGLGAFKSRLNFDSDARTFAAHLVRVLQDHGTLQETGQPALVSLLLLVREVVSGNEREAAFLDTLLAPHGVTVGEGSHAAAAAQLRVQPAAQTIINNYQTIYNNGGVVAQGPGATALGAGAVHVGGSADGAQIVTGNHNTVAGGNVQSGGVTISDLEHSSLTVGGSVVGGDYVYRSTHIHEAPPDPEAARREQARRQYLERLARQCDVLPLPSVGSDHGGARQLTLSQVYQALDTTTRVPLTEAERAEREKASYRWSEEDRKTRPQTAVEAATRHPRLVLLGAPGSGKSSFVLHLAGHVAHGAASGASDGAWPSNVVPVVLRLREIAAPLQALDLASAAAERQEQLLGVVREQLRVELRRLEAPDFEAGLREALHAGTVLLVLDGLDEVAVAARERVRATVDALLERYPVARVIVTCRTRSYEGEAVLPGFAREEIAPFTADQVNRFVGAWYGAQQRLGRLTPEVARERVADLQGAVRSRDLEELSTNPMLLTQMALIHQADTRLPNQRVMLYERTVELLMERWHADKGIALPEALAALLRDRRLLRVVMERLGYEAHQAQAEQRGEGDLTRGEMLTLLEAPEYLGSLGLVEAFVDFVDERAGILVGQGGAGGRRPAHYRFPHRTFQEYLAGCHLFDGRSKAIARRLRERAEAGEFWQVAVLLGAEESFHNKRDTDTLLDVAYKLSPADAPATAGAWRGVLWAGQIVRLVGVEAIRRDADESGERDYLPRLIQRLVHLVQTADVLPLMERAEAGRVLAALGDPRDGVGVRADGVPDIVWVRLEGGRFTIGGDERAYEPLDEREVELPTFWMAKYPVTNAQWQAFVDDAEGYGNERWWQEAGVPQQEREEPRWAYANHPRETVNWYEAVAYCRWLSAKVGYEVRLPTEEEWERGARGAEGRLYPWGDEWDASKANTWAEPGVGQTSAVGLYAQGATLEGICDLSGNVWEWTSSNYFSDQLDITSARVLRGGSWDGYPQYARACSRYYWYPQDRVDFGGFRLVGPAVVTL